MQGGDPRIPMSRGCYSSHHFSLMPWVSIPSLPLAGGAGTAPAPGDSPEPQKTPQLGVGAGKGPAWMCNHLLASLPVGFGDSHRLLCSLSRARHAWALSHPAPRVGFCPDISFSGGSWAFTAGAVVLWHMEGGSSARALAADRYERYHCSTSLGGVIQQRFNFRFCLGEPAESSFLEHCGLLRGCPARVGSAGECYK